MPHLHVEYSDHLAAFESQELLLALNSALFNTGLFAQADDIKARARCDQEVVIGLANPKQAYIFVQLAILTGRTAAQKKLLSETLLVVLENFRGYHATDLTLQLCVEITEIDQDSYGKVVRQLP